MVRIEYRIAMEMIFVRHLSESIGVNELPKSPFGHLGRTPDDFQKMQRSPYMPNVITPGGCMESWVLFL